MLAQSCFHVVDLSASINFFENVKNLCVDLNLLVLVLINKIFLASDNENWTSLKHIRNLTILKINLNLART